MKEDKYTNLLVSRQIEEIMFFNAIKQLRPLGYSPRDIINLCSINYKRAWYILDKWTGKGYYNYGVTLDLGWLEIDEYPVLKNTSNINTLRICRNSDILGKFILTITYKSFKDNIGKLYEFITKYNEKQHHIIIYNDDENIKIEFVMRCILNDLLMTVVSDNDINVIESEITKLSKLATSDFIIKPRKSLYTKRR